MELLATELEKIEQTRESFAYVHNLRVVFRCRMTNEEADTKNINLERNRCIGRYCKTENLKLKTYTITKD